MLEFETYIPIAEVASLLPGRPSLSTVTRWATRGVRGVRLPTITAVHAKQAQCIQW